MSAYAPQYSKQERLRIVLLNLAWFIPLYLASDLWLGDWLTDYLKHSGCLVSGDISRAQLVMYGLFGGFPLFAAFLLAVFEGRRSIKVLQLGQDPLPGEKVFRKTLYRYGWQTRIRPTIVLAAIVVLLLTGVWGITQVPAWTAGPQACAQSN
ncbi:hypothetical protein [Oceanobacter mangrovi]|uniref:hypothetical protein n=1 Tax=Oceanobacter mangrovi TaxID=2862510 RepID=UPI001C8D7BE3|nr:hypothetical protein [Oceanobacter mangrovi]